MFSTVVTFNENVIEWKPFPRCWTFVRGIHQYPLTRASDAELWCFLWSLPEKWLGKQSRGRWFETPSCSLWLQCNVLNVADRNLPMMSNTYSRLFYFIEIAGVLANFVAPMGACHFIILLRGGFIHQRGVLYVISQSYFPCCIHHFLVSINAECTGVFALNSLARGYLYGLFK